jgi:hypothetical protein
VLGQSTDADRRRGDQKGADGTAVSESGEGRQRRSAGKAQECRVGDTVMHLPDDLVEQKQADDTEAGLAPSGPELACSEPVAHPGGEEEQILQRHRKRTRGPERLLDEPADPGVQRRLTGSIEGLQLLCKQKLFDVIHVCSSREQQAHEGVHGTEQGHAGQQQARLLDEAHEPARPDRMFAISRDG